MRKPITWLILLVLATLSACNMGASSDGAANMNPTAGNSSLAPPLADLTETYTDSELGFAVDYPAGWRVEAQPGVLLQIFSPLPPDHTPQPRSQGEGFPADQTKLEFIPHHPGDARSIEQVVADMQANRETPSGAVASAQQITLPDGISGWRVAMESGVVSLILDVNGRILYASGYGDLSRFDEVMNTVRLTQ